MTMKKFDLEKNKALKLGNQMKQSLAADRFGKASPQQLDRREQRKLDQAKGLVPFACKLPDALVEQLKERAATHPEGMNGLIATLLANGLAAGV